MKNITLAIALSMSLATGSAHAGIDAPSGSNDDKVIIGAVVIGLALWLMTGKGSKGSAGMSTSSKNADSGTGTGKVLKEF